MVKISTITEIVKFRVKGIDQGTKIKRKTTTKILEMEDNLSKHLLLLILKTNGTMVAGKRCRTKDRKERKASSNSNRTRERVAMEDQVDSNSITYRTLLTKKICNHSSSRKMSSIRIPIPEAQVVKKDLSSLLKVHHKATASISSHREVTRLGKRKTKQIKIREATKTSLRHSTSQQLCSIITQLVSLQTKISSLIIYKVIKVLMTLKIRLVHVSNQVNKNLLMEIMSHKRD